MNPVSIRTNLVLAGSLLALAACGGGGSGITGGGSTNAAPLANAGASQVVDEQTTVTLDGSASSDPDGDALSYSWTQTAGASVILSNASAAQASFESPDVGIGNSTTLTFQLRVGDGNGAFNTATIDVAVNGVSNTDPVVNAGNDQSSTEQATVGLSGSASDSDIGDTLSYSWTQTSGTSVTISNADQPLASFQSPAVGAAGETLIFQLAVTDGTSTVTDTIAVSVSQAATAVTISGKVQYEFVPPLVLGSGCSLDFASTQTRPIRAATVQLIDDATGSVLDSIVASNTGDYDFSNVPPNRQVRVRVRAELKRSGAPSWDVEVRDNVDTSANPPPLGSRPLYVYEETFNSGGAANLVRNVTATTGWGGLAYTGTRAAAPFAILDAIYSGMLLVLSADATANFGPMDAFWSVNNTLTSPSDIDAGELSSSFYRGDLDSLFLLGDASTDTEEFDDHVSIHEWGHYFEDVFSRSDSIGGSHSIGQSLDARLAFGEGWATALAAMALDEPIYCDTNSGTGFNINTETNNSGPQGWFNEMSVATFLYDLFDTNTDGTDSSSIGFGPIFDTMAGPQSNTEAFTTLFSFAAELRPQLNAADQAFLDSQLLRENIETTGLDIWGSSQNSIVTSPNQARDVLPLYTTMPLDGSTINICTNSDYDSGRDGNKLAQYRYLRFTTTNSQRYTVTMTTTTPTPVTADTSDRDQSDPDIYIFSRGQVVAAGVGVVENSETFTTQTLAPGTYVADPRDYRFEDEDGAPANYPGQICFDISMTPL